jgi:membrane protease YdiL (CAAX protease family)
VQESNEPTAKIAEGANASTGSGGSLTPRSKPSPFFSVCLYFLFVFVGTAICAPRFHATAQFLFQEVNWRFGRLAGQPAHRYICGTLTLLAIVALPLLLRSLRIRSANDLGLKPGLRHFGEAAQGAAWGLISFLLLSALLLASNIRVFDSDNSARWVADLKSLVLSAAAMAFFAELIFRGAFFTAFRRTQSFWTAALCSGVFHAVFYFLEKPKSPRRLEWNYGFEALGQMLGPFTDPQMLVPALLNLILFSVLLALARERTGALHFSIGLHASAILCFKSYGLLTNPVSKEDSAFWGSDKLIDGWAATIMLLLVFLFIERTLPPRKALQP